MKCTHCEHKTRVVETRIKESEWLTHRTLECLGPDKHRFSSIEMPETFLWGMVSANTFSRMLAKRTRGVVRRYTAERRRMRVIELAAKPLSQAEIAEAVGCSQARVGQIMKEEGL